MSECVFPAYTCEHQEVILLGVFAIVLGLSVCNEQHPCTYTLVPLAEAIC